MRLISLSSSVQFIEIFEYEYQIIMHIFIRKPGCQIIS